MLRRSPVLVYVLVAFGLTGAVAMGAVRDDTLAASGYWHALGALGPFAGAFAARHAAGGRGAVRAMLRAYLRAPRRVEGWMAALAPFALFAFALAVTGGAEGSHRLGDPAWWAQALVVSFAYGFGEEAGWRGFLQPHLEHRHRAGTAALLVAVVWLAWHTPMFFYRLDAGGVAGFAGFGLSLAAGAVFLAALYHGTGGSLLAVAAFHTLYDVVSVVGLEAAPATVPVTGALVFVLAAVAVLWGTWDRLGRRSALARQPRHTALHPASALEPTL